jgi:hypothetical protein
VVKNVSSGAPAFGEPYGTIPEGTELLGKVDVSGYEIGYLHNTSPARTRGWHNRWVLIAYKTDQQSGRMVLSAGHPEYGKTNEHKEFTAAIYQYAMDGGQQIPDLKGTLENGIPVDMSGAQEAVGDRQYHRYTFNLPQDVNELVITAEGLTDNVDLFLNPECPAHDENAAHRAVNPDGPDETILVEDPAAGEWHLSVYGNHDTRNGAGYLLTASWR